MRVIKRYSNRRLYDTESSRTITQSDLSEMVKEGIELKVIDSQT
ncbi:MAG: polyhydroxyalkanoate biosynthesis repressor PhaR, partial [candidate division Zixibacteria bacterium]|nr:polyhydroxyalkanoate biosynthesis repressor PhaR [candidate division Zixibacteria bacterium]